MKRAFVICGALVAASVTSSADAAPVVARRVWATATYELVTSPRDSIRVDIYAELEELGTRVGSSQLRLALSRCRDKRCGRAVEFAGMLPAGAFSVDGDLKRATLRGTAFGQPLYVRWTGGDITANDVKAELYSPVLPSGQARVFAREQRSGGAQAGLLNRSCRVARSFITRDSVIDGVAPTPLPAIPDSVPAAFRDVVHARCG